MVENGKNDQFVDESETKSNFLWQPNAKNSGSLGDSIDNQQKYGVIGWQQRWK